MSAYGKIDIPLRISTEPFPPQIYPASGTSEALAVHHMTLRTTPTELIKHMYDIFSAELERGRTYPQEGPMSEEQFTAYFFSADVFIGLLGDEGTKVEDTRECKEWSARVAGFYYVRSLSYHPNLANAV